MELMLILMKEVYEKAGTYSNLYERRKHLEMGFSLCRNLQIFKINAPAPVIASVIAMYLLIRRCWSVQRKAYLSLELVSSGYLHVNPIKPLTCTDQKKNRFTIFHAFTKSKSELPCLVGVLMIITESTKDKFSAPYVINSRLRGFVTHF